MIRVDNIPGLNRVLREFFGRRIDAVILVHQPSQMNKGMIKRTIIIEWVEPQQEKDLGKVISELLADKSIASETARAKEFTRRTGRRRSTYYRWLARHKKSPSKTSKSGPLVPEAAATLELLSNPDFDWRKLMVDGADGQGGDQK